MPQATPELRARMVAKFGDNHADGPVRFLESHGFTLSKDGAFEWLPPVGRGGELTEEEHDCVTFLMDEWDFGEVIQPTESP